jgi:hypothetical protein
MTTFWLCGPAVHQPEVKMESFPAVGATKSLKALFVARCAVFSLAAVWRMFIHPPRSRTLLLSTARWTPVKISPPLGDEQREIGNEKISNAGEKTLTWSKDQ